MTALVRGVHRAFASATDMRGKSNSGRGGGGGDRGYKRGDDPMVRLSKLLARVLRHRADDMGLNMRKDGYVRVQELVSLYI